MKKLAIFFSLIFIMNVFSSCSTKNSNKKLETNDVKVEQKNKKKSNDIEAQEKKEKSSKETSNQKMRKIKDLTGKEWEIPQAKDIKKVMIISPPLLSYYSLLVGDHDKLVGVNPLAYTVSGKDFLEVMLPERKKVKTGFIKGFVSNAEEVIKIDPDIILVYGDFQKKGLENIDIPVIDFFQKTFDNKEWSNNTYDLMKEIFDFKGESDLENEWKKAEQIVHDALKKVPDDQKKSALIIHQNRGEELLVQADASFHADYMKKSGVNNAVANLKKQVVMQQNLISMEDVYAKDPDIIYDFEGRDADDYLQGKISGQDWKDVRAVKNKKVYDFPQGAYNWGAAGLEGPLTILWMTMKNYPDTIKEDFFKKYMKDYYQRMFHITMDDKLQESILNPKKP